MKSAFSKTLLLFSMIIACFSARSQYSEELLKLARIDLLPRYDDESEVKQLSSYDRTGGNDDGFSGKYSFLRKENGNLVIADLQGAGIIQRIWTPTPTEDTIQFFFNDELTPRISCKFIDLFSGNKYPFERPVVGNEVGGYYCYLPIPYSKSCKVVFKGKRMQFFQIQYRELHDGLQTETFPRQFSNNDKKALSEVVRFWKNYGNSIIHSVPENQLEPSEKVVNISLKPGEKLPFFEMNNGGRICGIEIIPKIELNTQFKDILLRATWDEEKMAAINCPLVDFFGYAFGKPSMQSLLAGVKENKHYCYFPMPFDEEAILELEYLKHENATSEIPFEIHIFFNQKKRTKEEGKFYVKWNHDENPAIGQPYEILEKNGKGHYVGTILQAQGRNSGMTVFFEGDDKCVVDGELRLHGTGSEDYFNGGWYALADRWDQAFSLPVHGCLAYSIPLAHTGGYRFLVSDKIPFTKKLNQTIEHGPENNNVPVNYVSVAFYYCDTRPTENNTPEAKLLTEIETPDLLEYWLQLLPVKALCHGSTLSYKNVSDQDGKSFDVMELRAEHAGFVKFELEVPEAGKYELFMSYLKGTECGDFSVNQRQIPVKTTISGYAGETEFVEKEFIGELDITQGTNTITIALNKNDQVAENMKFLLHRIYLKKLRH